MIYDKARCNCVLWFLILITDFLCLTVLKIFPFFLCFLDFDSNTNQYGDVWFFHYYIIWYTYQSIFKSQFKSKLKIWSRQIRYIKLSKWLKNQIKNLKSATSLKRKWSYLISISSYLSQTVNHLFSNFVPKPTILITSQIFDTRLLQD